MSSIRCGHCGKLHQTAEAVRACGTKSQTLLADGRSPEAPTRCASKAQVNYAQMLYRTRQPLPVDAGMPARTVEERIQSLDFVEIGIFIDMMKRQPEREHRLTAGMYKFGNDIYKVQKAIYGSGNLYAKKWYWDRKPVEGHFDYSPGGIYRLRPEHKMSLEEAKQFGKLYGRCCVCGRILTDEESIEAGIGPVCAGKEGWFSNAA